MRDTLKDKNYFDLVIKERYVLFESANEKINQGLVKEERISNIKKSLFNHCLTIVKAKYSRGDNMFGKDLKVDYLNGLQMMIDSWKQQPDIMRVQKNRKVINLKQYTFSGFLDMLNMLSIGILLDIDDENVSLLSKTIENDQVKDFLFEFILNYRFNDREIASEESYTSPFDINERYGRLKSIIKEDDKNEAQKELEIFLEKEWYPSLKKTPLYDQHKNVHNTYSGYWCFIAAAIVKIKGLDDSKFRNNQYYPKDLI